MALQQTRIVDKIEILEQGQIQVRERIDIFDDINPSIIISSSYHRWLFNPDDDVSAQNAKVQAIANAVWTEEVKSTYRAMLEARGA
jgi:hypothetical protein